MLAKRAYKCLFYPTPTQEQALAQHFECVKFVYNQMPVRRRQRHKDGECSCYGEDAAALTALKRTLVYLFCIVALQASLQHLDTCRLSLWSERKI
jgi:putative transposase